MNKVIQVDNLSKKYIISRNNDGKYIALRDVIAAKVKGVFAKKQTEDLFKEDFYALRDINFSVEKGDRVGIVGRNGAGKSTLLKVLSQITEPTSGTIGIKGRVASLLEVGTGFHPELSGRENIYLNGAILGMTRVEIKKKFDQIVDFSEVEKFLDTPVKRYSSGMYVKLAFAVAAHMEPEILIVDEVLSVGDIEFQKKCLGKMEDVSVEEGRTVLFVSHNMATIKALCTSCMLMSEGRITHNGTVDDILNEYMAINKKVLNIDGIIPEGYSSANTGVIRYVSAKLTNQHAENDIFYLEPIKFDLNLDSVQTINDVILDIRICNAQGIEVVHACNKYENYYKKFPIKPGSNTVKVELDNSLQPGSYTVTLGVHEIDGTTLDYVENIISMNVLKVSREGEGYMFNFDMGLVRFESQWQIEN